ncbi:cell wall assembly regulator SMI1 [Actinoalloteichus hoggarensis]|uniref:SMI1 / KNR4 family protein n=1 Tax=Actinoalloteichus hoggarensis TaxID=1470176 RepID=A0A221WAA0_9PSEU|nr:SMI1/KNR4 family protein [Actinoalloteichus hoggarensis]ASO22664.1 SMI1 / KNR4 family protein [Actinoalloteichus hoggarensis]MBB5924194.1 cell wall assembly regulator SMI1 [Actinoalloteichus hoggarensis]
MEVLTQWNRILQWSARYAPGTHAQLADGASGADIDAAEREFGFEVNPELRSWWSVCGGTRELRFAEVFPPFYTPCGPAESARSWLVSKQVWRESWEQPDAGRLAGSRAHGYHPRFVPIAFDGMGDHLVVDLRPGPLRGAVAEWDHELCHVEEPRWPSLAALFADVAEALETGSVIDHSRAWVDPDGQIDWQIGNWTETGSAGR